MNVGKAKRRLGDLIKDLRDEFGLSVRVLAKKSGINRKKILSIQAGVGNQEGFLVSKILCVFKEIYVDALIAVNECLAIIEDALVPPFQRGPVFRTALAV